LLSYIENDLWDFFIKEHLNAYICMCVFYFGRVFEIFNIIIITSVGNSTSCVFIDIETQNGKDNYIRVL